MKIFIETKKILVAACIFSSALFIFPVSSFGGGALVCPNEGEIEGLVFDFGEGLPVTLPGLEGPIIITCAEVVAPGREIIIITPSGQYNYDAKIEGGSIFATTEDVNCGSDWEADLEFEFESATLNEHFIIGDIDLIPDCEVARTFQVPEDIDVDLFFKAKETILVDEEGAPLAPPFNFMLKLKDSLPQIFMLK
jgi:hypothetical protein